MKKIVFLYPQGRLGNLLFQYQAVKHLFSQDSFVVSVDHYGLGELIYLEDNFKFIKFNKYLIKFRIVEALKSFLFFLARKNVISYFYEETLFVNEAPLESGKYIYAKGMLSTIIFVRGYFQTDIHSLVELPCIRPCPTISTSYVLNKNDLVGIHFRFTDYETLNVMGKINAILPKSYYQSAINLIRAKVDNPKFLIFSDDRVRAEKYLCDILEDYTYCCGTEYEDFISLSKCDHLIISASSFSWWAGFLSNKMNKIVIAPKFWLGFKSSVWCPARIKTEQFFYIEV